MTIVITLSMLFGTSEVKTPFLDRLALQGTSYCNTHIMGGLTGAVCVPSRAVLHTGVNVFSAIKVKEVHDGPKANIQGNDFQVMNEHVPLLAETLKQSGYYTHAIGKWHNDKKSFNRSFCGGDKIFFGGMSDHNYVPVYDFDPEGKYPEEKRSIGEKFSTEMFCDAAINFLDTYNEEDPFMLYMAFTSPHDPRTAPKEYAEIYDSTNITLPENFLGKHPFDNGHLRLRDEDLASFPRKPDEIKQHIAEYYAMITHMDAEIGRVLKELEKSGELDNTIIVYTSDHGLAVGQHGLLGKQNLYDHSVHIPLIIRGPNIISNKRIDALTYSYDLYPTLCELVGTEIPPTVEGKSLVPLMTEEKDEIRNSVYSVYQDIQRMVRDKRWKLIRYYYSDVRKVGTNRIQLFDLKHDPWEQNDLSTDSTVQDHIDRLLAELEKWQIIVNDPLYYKEQSSF